MAALDLGIDGIARQPVLPERGLEGRLEMRLVPDVAAEPAPVRMPGLQVGLIDRESHRIHLGDELRLARDGIDVLGIDGLAEAHIIVSADGITIRLEIDVVLDIEVHAASNSLYHKAIASGDRLLEIDVPDIRAGQVLLTGLELRGSLGLPVLDGTDLLGLAGGDVVQIDALALEGLVVALSALAEPQIQVGLLDGLGRKVAENVDVDGLRHRVPDVELHLAAGSVAADPSGDAHGVGAALLHRPGEFKEDPMVQFAGQGVVGVHRLGLAPRRDGRPRAEGLVVLRTHQPGGCIRRRGLVQPRAEHHQRIVALDEGMAEVCARPLAGIAVTDLSVTEMHAEIVLVYHFQFQILGRPRLYGGEQGGGREGCAENASESHNVVSSLGLINAISFTR